MTWDTQNEAYGSFHPDWRRVYLSRTVDPYDVGNLRNRQNTTSHEYGSWFQRPQHVHEATHPHVHSTVPLQARLRTPRTPPEPISGSLLPPIVARKPKLKAASEGDAMTSSDSGPTLCLPDVKAVDVQLLTSENALVSIAPSASGVYKYTYPRGISDVALPDIKELNVKFKMKDNKVISMRAKPQLENDDE